jgi:hypothetical protein
MLIAALSGRTNANAIAPLLPFETTHESQTEESDA